MTLASELRAPRHAEGAFSDLPDRIVVSPGYGTALILEPGACTTEGELVYAGQSLARVASADGDMDVAAPSDAWVVTYLVRDGERVEPGTAVVHLRCL